MNKEETYFCFHQNLIYVLSQVNCCLFYIQVCYNQTTYLLWVALAAVLHGTNPGPGFVTAGMTSSGSTTLVTWTYTPSPLGLTLERGGAVEAPLVTRMVVLRPKLLFSVLVLLRGLWARSWLMLFALSHLYCTKQKHTQESWLTWCIWCQTSLDIEECALALLTLLRKKEEPMVSLLKWSMHKFVHYIGRPNSQSTVRCELPVPDNLSVLTIVHVVIQTIPVCLLRHLPSQQSSNPRCAKPQCIGPE